MCSEDVGRGLRRALRVFALGVLAIVAGENMASLCSSFVDGDVSRPELLIARI
jgi:hypothetical protein